MSFKDYIVINRQKQDLNDCLIQEPKLLAITL